MNELKANLEGEVRYWRTTGKAEVDFIIKLNSEVISVEVKTRGKLGRGFRSFLEAYEPKRQSYLLKTGLDLKRLAEQGYTLPTFSFRRST